MTQNREKSVLIKWIRALGIVFIICLLGALSIIIYSAFSSTTNTNEVSNPEPETTTPVIAMEIPEECNHKSLHQASYDFDLSELIKDQINLESKALNVDCDKAYKELLLEYMLVYLKSNIECPQFNKDLVEKLKFTTHEFISLSKSTNSKTLNRKSFLHVMSLKSQKI